ncbi:MAG: response regulator [Defluviitaleaceae bacterium]|nr:response regulator [Defluviitaleaceae bacterium]MCL2263417.1 response regulator [Defluviitaleaceae bacterium]
MRKTVFVVDDNDTNLSKAEESLEDIYDVMTIPSGARLFAILKKVKPDLILLDIEMPEMDGFQVLEQLRQEKDYKNIPVVFLTGVRSPEVEARCFESGAVDFVTKPFSTPVLLNRVKLHTDVHLLIKEHTEKLEKSHQNMIFIMADLVENRDSGTGGHIERTSEYVKVLVAEMQKKGVYSEEIKEWDSEMMSICAILHDIGKIGVSDTILNKPGRLTEEEFSMMKSHASNGAKLITRVIARNGEDEFLQNALLFAEYHHESWDGSGYPHGRKGLEIPIQGRVMAIADVYDALISERPYKPAFSHEKAVDIIMEDSGKRFDPEIANVFQAIHEQFKSVQLTIRGK